MSDSRALVPRGRNLVVPATESLQDSPRRLVIAGVIIGSLFFVFFLGWAALARLDASAIGSGQVKVMGNRQTVQHRDGGVVAQLKVREGQHVTAGQVLIQLAGDEVRAQERAFAGSVIDLQAQRARLEAELTGQRINWPAEFRNPRPEDRELTQRAMTLQERQFSMRRSSLDAAANVTQQQVAAISEQSRGNVGQSDATARQRASLEDQLARSRGIAEKGYVSMNYIRQLERGIAQLDGSNADFESRVAAAREQIGQVRGEYLQTQRRWSEDGAALLRDTQAQLNEQMPRLQAARQQLERLLIRAPATGRVVGLQVFTVGGVISAGQPLMDIVPDRAPLIVQAQFDPADIDGVVPDAEAEVQFQSLHEGDIPILLGKVRTVSADSLTDEKSGRNYFKADIVVPDSEMARLRAVRGADTGVKPGVPVQVFVQLRKRTALQYLTEPLTETFRHSFHER